MLRALLTTGLIFLTTTASASITTGDTIAPFTLNDQHDVATQIDKSTKYIVFAKDKAASKIVGEAFKEVDKDYFPSRNMLYVADVSGMPGFALSWFALPKMKKYPFQVVLDKEPEFTKDFPLQTDQVSLITLENLVIKKIEYFSKADELKSATDKK